MKKLTLLACMLTATLAYGQGLVQFANTSGTLLTTNRNVSGAASGNMAGAQQYVIGLFIGPTGSGYSSLTPISTYGFNSSTFGGRFSVSANQALPAPYDGTSAIAIQVRAWSVGLGADWATVSGKLQGGYTGTGNASANFAFTPGTYYLGASSIASITPAQPGIGIPTPIFGPSAITSGFALNEVIPIPEPTTLALLGLGLTGLLFIRRRK